MEKEDIYGTQYGPYLTTKWDQKAPFNSLLPDPEMPLGCVTIATAQLMRYQRILETYYVSGSQLSWDAMPDTYSNQVLSTFLKDLRARLKIDNNGNGYLSDAASLLSSFPKSPRYTYSKYRHYSVIDNLRKGNVVLLSGIKKGEQIGHAWVCDGADDIDYGTEYSVYILDAMKYPVEFDYKLLKKEKDININQVANLHMNWGWGGWGDGWFYNDNWTPTAGINTYDFSYNKNMVAR